LGLGANGPGRGVGPGVGGRGGLGRELGVMAAGPMAPGVVVMTGR